MTDLDIIKQIEKELNIKLTALDKIEWNRKGYVLNQNGKVTDLGLYDCNLKSWEYIISPLKMLTNLTRLNLRQNQLSNISPLNSLTNLTDLNLSYNQLSDVSALQALTKLTNLDLSQNQISDISPLRALKDLTYLHLYNNPLNDILPLKDLKKLSMLNLTHIPIKELPEWITNFNMKIVWGYGLDDGYIYLMNNPLRSPPVEIVKQGKEAIRNYFGQLKKQEEDYLFEAKLLIVGEPGAGKTSMAWKIESSDCDLPKEEETTKGIDVRQYYFPLRKEDFPGFSHPAKLENRKFRVNLWDFGGQEIYKATHRFFLSKRSLYVLLADSRNEDTDFNYWLHIVEMFGGESPLLVVLNEKFGRKRNIDISAMQKRFTNISETIQVDFAENDKSRLENLKKSIRYFISRLPHVGSPVPAKWTVIREVLERDNRNTITRQDYLAICKDNGITESADALVLSQYFHDLGVFLHFQDDELLNKTIFLKPNWVTYAVYKILDDELLNKQNGRFTKNDAKKIWCEEEYQFLCDELLKLMQKFFLTYEIDHTGEYIVPDRVHATPSAYEWDERDNLFLHYAYDFFMPKGIMSQFIVQMHRYIGNHDWVWKKGVILERKNTRAEIIETYDARAIRIRVSGQNKRDFMTIITEQFDQINTQYEKMKVDKMIPCNCSKCKIAVQPYFFEYEKLKRRLDNNIHEIDCENSYEKVDIRSLIDEVIDQNRVKRNKIFVSYSHKDRDFLKRVQIHLKVLENEGISIHLWDDTKIKSGMKWRNEIEKALDAAKVAILLVSTDFLASEFITKIELPRLLKAAEVDGATILPLILKPCRFLKNKELSVFQTVNDPLNPLFKLTEAEQDELLLKLADRIEELMGK